MLLDATDATVGGADAMLECYCSNETQENATVVRGVGLSYEWNG